MLVRYYITYTVSALFVARRPDEGRHYRYSGVVVLAREDVEEGDGLGDGELEPELGPVVVVEDGAEGVLLQRVVDLPRRHANLRIIKRNHQHQLYDDVEQLTQSDSEHRRRNQVNRSRCLVLVGSSHLRSGRTLSPTGQAKPTSPDLISVVG